MRKYELSLTANYVPEWTIVEAVREFFQNALDQETQQDGNTMFYEYRADCEQLVIGNLHSVLTANTLLLGSTTKADDKNTIGQFGEGYKIATLVAIRTGHEVTFYNYGAREVWRPRFVQSRRYNAQILTFFTDTHKWTKVPDNNLTITIDGVTQEEYNEIMYSNLHMQVSLGKTIETDMGTVLCESRYAGRIYVNGLFIKEEKELTKGYDLPASAVILDRDRRMMSTFDLQWYTSKLWAKADSQELVTMAADKAGDVEYVGSMMYGVKNEVREQALANFREEHGDMAIPVSDQGDMRELSKEYENAVPVITTTTERALITTAKSYVIKAEKKLVVTQRDMLEAWLEKVMDKLTDEEIEEFNDILEV